MSNLITIKVDLDYLESFDDETVAKTIREAINDELRRAVKRLATVEIKKQEAALTMCAKRAVAAYVKTLAV